MSLCLHLFYIPVYVLVLTRITMAQVNAETCSIEVRAIYLIKETYVVLD